jgi:hypothetical protein
MIKEALMTRIQSLTKGDMQVLDDVLTPEVSSVLNKIVPEIEPLLTQFTQNDQFATGGRVHAQVGGPIDFDARAKQSQADYLARQGQGASTPQPINVSYQTPSGSSAGAGEQNPGTMMNIGEGPATMPSSVPGLQSPNGSPNTYKGYTPDQIMQMSPEETQQKLGYDPITSQPPQELDNFMTQYMPTEGVIGAEQGLTGSAVDWNMGEGGTNMAILQERGIDPSQFTTPQLQQKAVYASGTVDAAKELADAGFLPQAYTFEELMAMPQHELDAMTDLWMKEIFKPGSAYVGESGGGSNQKSQVQQTQEAYDQFASDTRQDRGNSNYAQGGRANFKYGSDDARIKKFMKADFRNPFSKLLARDKKNFQSYNKGLTSYVKKKIASDKKNAAKKKKPLLTLNAEAKQKALKRLALLQKLYRGK